MTQGAFSFLPDLDDEQITAQLRYALTLGCSISVEHTDDPHPRNAYWDMWGQPLFDLEPTQAATALAEVRACREAFPRRYVKVIAYDSTYGRQTAALTFIVGRPPDEPGFELTRTEGSDRRITYGLRSYAAQDPPGQRYGGRT